ncbi:MAG: cyclomaltodextrinase N-terminal domain-containing protein, partial [Bacteroidota bacterium]
MKKYIVYLIVLMLSTTLSSQIKHVEPPFWWSDMKSKELQIMIHGDNIAQYTPQIEGITIKNIQK